MRIISCALVIPAAHRTEMNVIGEALGYGPDNLSVPLSADGAEPASHYGCHTWCDAEFIALLANPPPEYAGSGALVNLAFNFLENGVPEETFGALLDQLVLLRVEVSS